jgi:hypothetical protein
MGDLVQRFPASGFEIRGINQQMLTDLTIGGSIGIGQSRGRINRDPRK